MAFRTALSGLNAASTELNVTGNNVANVNTTGFKSSRAQFADVINAGALAVPTLIDFVRRLARAPDIDCNARVAESELATSARNAAMAYFMKCFGCTATTARSR